MAVVNLTLPQIFDMAFKRAGKELQTGDDIRQARLCFNVLMLEWQNKGINLWTVDQEIQSLTAGTATYALTTDTVDVLEAVYRDSNGKDYALRRISYPEYMRLNDKDLSGRPTQYYISRLVNSTEMTLWPVPNEAREIVYWRARGLDGLTSGIGDGANPDVPPRFVPALIAGLAFNIAMEYPELERRVVSLKQFADEAFQLATEEDRQRGVLKMVPRVR